MTPRTRAGLIKFRPVRRGSRVALIAPASPFDRAHFDAGVAELTRLGFDPVFDESVFERQPIVAGSAASRAQSFMRACTREDVDAVIAVRGGYGSVEILPMLESAALRRARTAIVGYSDITSLHTQLNCHVHLASVHGPMIEGRLATGISAYDQASFLTSMSAEALGELAPEALDVVRPGEVMGPIFGGTLTQITGSLATPYEFFAPRGHVLFIDDVAERPYRLRRALTQLRLSGRLSQAAAVVFNQLPRCDEPGGAVTARGVVDECLADFPGPVLFGFPSGHATGPSLSFPFGVQVTVVARANPRLVFLEAGAE
ncbi:MAG: LD-carboxypeptidase [Acidobacteriota bacterium]